MSSVSSSLSLGSNRAQIAQQGLPSTEITAEQIAIQGLRMMHQIRSSVRRTFFFASVGRERNTSSVDIPPDKQFLRELKMRLADVAERYENLEKLSQSNVTRPSNLLSESGQRLIRDSSLDIQCQSLYSDLIDVNNWSESIQEYTRFNAIFLQPHRRIFSKTMPKPSITSQTITLPEMHQTLNDLRRAFPYLHITPIEHTASSILLMMIVSTDANLPNTQPKFVPVMKVALALRYMIPEWLKIKGPDEDFLTDAGKLDLSSASRHLVFRKLTDHLTSTYLTGTLLNVPDLRQMKPLVPFLMVISKYRFLYSHPCKACGLFVRDGLPPLIESGRTIDRNVVGFVHESCR